MYGYKKRSRSYGPFRRNLRFKSRVRKANQYSGGRYTKGYTPIRRFGRSSRYRRGLGRGPRRVFKRRVFRRFSRRRRGFGGIETLRNKAIGGPVNFNGVESGRLTVSTQGTQYIFGGASNWDYLSNTNPCLLLPHTLVLDIQQSLPVENIGASIPNAQPAAPYYQNPDKFVISRAVVNTTMSNPQNYPINVEATTWVARRHIPAELATLSAQQIITDSFLSAGTQITSLVPGVTLFQAPQWCTMFKCTKKQTCFLRPGEQQSFQLARMRPWFVDMQKFFTKSAVTGTISYSPFYYCYGGVTKIIMFRLWAGVANDATVVTNVSYSAPSVDFATQYHVVAHPIARSVNINLGTLQGDVALDSGLTLRTIGTETDAVITNASV